MTGTPLLLTVVETKDRLRVSIATVYNLFAAGELRRVKIRGRTFVRQRQRKPCRQRDGRMAVVAVRSTSARGSGEPGAFRQCSAISDVFVGEVYRVAVVRVLLTLSIVALVASACAGAQVTRTPAAIAQCFREHQVTVDQNATGFPKTVPNERVFVVTFKDWRPVSFAGTPHARGSRVPMHPTGLVVVNRSRKANTSSESAFLHWLHDSGATPTIIPTASQAHIVDYGGAWVQWNPAPLLRSKDHRTVLACLGSSRP